MIAFGVHGHLILLGSAYWDFSAIGREVKEMMAFHTLANIPENGKMCVSFGLKICAFIYPLYEFLRFSCARHT